MLKLVVYYQCFCSVCVDVVDVIVRDWERFIEAYLVELTRVLELDC